MALEHQAAADGLVIMMLIMMTLSLGMVALLFICMAGMRSAGTPT